MRILRFIVYSNVWVGMAVMAFAWLTLHELGRESFPYLLFTFFFTVATYNYMRLVQIRSYSGEHGLNQKFWLKQHVIQAVFFTVVFSFLGAWFYLELFSWRLVALTALPAVISFFYPLSFRHPFRSFTSLRAVPGLKVLLIAGSWAYITQLVPVIYWQGPETGDWVEFGLRSLFIVALIIPFDIRDMHMDDRNMRTIPQIFGVKRSKQLALFMIFIYAGWKALEIANGHIELYEGLAWILGLFYAGFLIFRMHPARSELYCGFWVEGTPILIAVIVFLLRLI
ncbi:MAG: hypothetical protein ACPF9D_10340 [Owenweeksia sp.]